MEGLLGVILREHFVRMCRDDNGIEGFLNELLESGHSTLGTFSARMKVARALGLISPQTYAALKEVNDLRISFAHYNRDFATDALRHQQRDALKTCA